MPHLLGVPMKNGMESGLLHPPPLPSELCHVFNPSAPIRLRVIWIELECNIYARCWCYTSHNINKSVWIEKQIYVEM